ncbi:MAG: acyltransferase [Candidatus Zixiibacteriota bacterium]|nr:MAG: acyltransferase [candidate division Zixibacteria bacterium]
MLVKHRGFEPVVDSSVFVAPTAVLVGNVRVGARSRIIYGAVLDSEGSRVEIGECTIVCENAVLRATASGDADYPVIIGDHVFISPHATLLGCTVESCSYLATGATVLHGATIRSGAAIAVGAFVHAKTVVPSGFFVPPNAVAIGDPVKLYGPDEKEALADAIKSIGFAKIAFGAEAKWEDRLSRYKQATEVRSKEFGSHFDDIVLED